MSSATASRRGRRCRPDRRARRRLRLPRAERGRQDDVAADSARADPPDRGIGPPLRARSADRRRGRSKASRVRRGAALLPVPPGRRNLSCSPTTTSRAHVRASRRCSSSSSCATGRRTGSAATRTGCGSGSASLRRCFAQPQLLLLDEPTTGLDPAGMRDMRELVRRLAGEGITILLSATCSTRSRSSATASRSSARADRLPGRAARPARDRGQRLSLRALEPERARAALLAQPGISDVAPRRRRPALQRRRRRGRGVFPRARPRRHRVHRARAGAASLEDLFLGMTAATRPTTTAPPRWPYDGGRARLPVGDREAARAEAHVPRARHGDASCRHLCRRARAPDAAGRTTAARPLHPRTVWRAVRRPLLHVDLGAAADDLVVAGDIVASETHNGTPKTMLPFAGTWGGLRARPRDVDLHRRARVRDGRLRLVAGSVAWGFHPLRRSRERRFCRHGLLCSLSSLLDLRAGARRRRGVRRLLSTVTGTALRRSSAR